MKLILNNIGKITKADIEINGLTVIAGVNGTGKSTVSKSLYAMFRSFYSIPKTVRREKKNAIKRRYYNVGSSEFIDLVLFNSKFTSSELTNILVAQDSLDKIFKIFEEYGLRKEDFGESFVELCSQILHINQLSEKAVLKEVVENIFQTEFYNNINSIFENNNAEITLKIKNDELSVCFHDNNLVDISEKYFSLNYEPVYIDDPFIVDRRNQGRIIFNSLNDGTHRSFLLSQYQRKKIVEFNAVEELLQKENLQLIFEKIEEILNEKEIEYSYDGDNSSKTYIDINNLSSGMKTFYLLKTLLTNGCIVSNAPIILDEPEVHLHPEWQLILAEIIVLLQKELSLHFLINTHSPYFLRAIEVYSNKHKIYDKVKFYEAKKVNTHNTIIEPVVDIKQIYKSLTQPLKIIELERGASL
ncbi:AAA family ATPase [Streptococcus infantis]|uniref:AAA family ATPase n=1 Tax=Streptococcus infantis TaxID=68892 RepID=UPI0039C037F4